MAGFWNRRKPRLKTDEQVKSSKAVIVVYLVLRIFVIVALITSLIREYYENAFVCLLVLVLFMLPGFVKRTLKVEMPSTLEIIIILFIFAAEILGELQSYYIHYQYWDTMLHTVNGFICAAIGFALVDILNSEQRIAVRLSPLFLSLAAFCFSMTVGVLWEFVEYFADTIFHLDMQKDTVINTIVSVSLDPTASNIPITISGINDVIINGKSLGLGGYLDVGLYDTMEDLLVNFIGAVSFSVIGFIDAKNKKHSKFAKQFILRVRQTTYEE
jgi:hypothetical protein